MTEHLGASGLEFPNTDTMLTTLLFHPGSHSPSACARSLSSQEFISLKPSRRICLVSSPVRVESNHMLQPFCFHCCVEFCCMTREIVNHRGWTLGQILTYLGVLDTVARNLGYMGFFGVYMCIFYKVYT